MAKMAKLVNPTWADIAHENLFDAKTVAEMIQVTVKALKKNLSEEQYIEAGRGLPPQRIDGRHRHLFGERRLCRRRRTHRRLGRWFRRPDE